MWRGLLLLYAVIYAPVTTSSRITFKDFSHVDEGLFGLALDVRSDQLHCLGIHSQLTGNVHRVSCDDGLMKKNEMELLK